jgi:hypothetical protein
LTGAKLAIDRGFDIQAIGNRKGVRRRSVREGEVLMLSAAPRIDPWTSSYPVALHLSITLRQFLL